MITQFYFNYLSVCCDCNSRDDLSRFGGFTVSCEAELDLVSTQFHGQDPCINQRYHPTLLRRSEKPYVAVLLFFFISLQSQPFLLLFIYSLLLLLLLLAS